MILEKALKKNSDILESKTKLIQAHIDNSDFDKAEVMIAEAAENYEGDLALIKLLAESRFKQGDFQSALDESSSVIKDDYTDSWMWEIQVLSLIFLGKLDLARQENNNALILFPNHLTFNLLDSKIHYIDGNLQESLVGINSLLTKFSDVFEVHDLASDIYVALNDIEKAKEHLIIAKKLNPIKIDVLNKLGWLYYGQSKISDALREFRESQDVSNEQSEAYFGEANCYFDSGDYEKALENCNKCIDFSDKDPRVWKLVLRIAHSLDNRALGRQAKEMLLSMGINKDNLHG